MLDERCGTGALVAARGTHTHSQLAREQGTFSVFELVLWAASTLCIEITVVFVELLRGISTL
jgi:hypothetical protein